MTFMEFLPMAVYILLIILLIILIIVGIKVIKLLDKSDKLMDDVQDKIDSFNPIFSLINMTSTKFNGIVTTIIDLIVSLLKKIKNKKEDE